MTIEKNFAELPAGWIWTKLKEISETTSGGTPSRRKKEYFGGNIPWLKSGELNNNVVNSAEETITEDGLTNSSAKIIPHGTLLMALYGATVGKLGILGIDAAINQAICAISPYEGVSTKFLFWYLTSYREELLNIRKGGAQPNISQEIVKDIPVPLAPFDEQVRIVARLEELFARLDAGVEGLRKVKAQLKRYRQAVLKYAFEGKLTEEWRKTHKDQIEPATKLLERIKQERREKLGPKYKEPPPTDASRLPELPESWMWTRIVDIGEVITGTTPRKSHPEYYGRDYPFFKPTDLNAGYYTKFATDGLSPVGIRHARLLPKKSILVTCIGATIGKTGFARVEGACNQQINAIVPNKEIIPEFVYFICIAPQFQKFILEEASATTLPILNKRRFELLYMPLPPQLEQQKIVEEIDRHFSEIEETEKIAEQSLKQAERLRQSILKMAFEGKLVPQDPSDEPAEKLLERIKEERTKSKGEKDINRRNDKLKQLELSTYVE